MDKHQQLFFVIFLISLGLLGITWTTSSVLAQGQTCHLRELDLCAASLLVLTQSPGGLATSEQEINKQCSHLRDSSSCMSNYTRRCMTPVQRELLGLTLNSSLQLTGEYCTRGSALRSGYLKHAQCLNQVQKKEQKGCVRDLQAALELLTGGSKEITDKRLQLACCTYRRFEQCLGNQVERKCGKDALGFINGLLRRATSRLPEILCRNYRPESQECRTLLPKPGTVPKGAKSSSILSRLVSAYTGL